jgi:membrane associated rhomboid family serine protease
VSIILELEDERGEACSSEHVPPTLPSQDSRHAYPIFTLLIISINICTYLWMFHRGVNPVSPSVKDILDWGGNFSPLVAAGEWWRLFTSLFIHVGLIHISLNLFFLFLVGRIFERLAGHRSFLILYFGSGMLASIGSAMWQPMIVSAGSSGAIYGVMGGLLAFFFSARGKRIRQAGEESFSVKTWLFYSLILGFYSETTDNAAHICGLLGGLALGLLLSRAYTVDRDHLKIRPSWRALALTLVIAITVLCARFFPAPKPYRLLLDLAPMVDQVMKMSQRLKILNASQGLKMWRHEIQPTINQAELKIHSLEKESLPNPNSQALFMVFSRFIKNIKFGLSMTFEYDIEDAQKNTDEHMNPALTKRDILPHFINNPPIEADLFKLKSWLYFSLMMDQNYYRVLESTWDEDVALLEVFEEWMHLPRSSELLNLMSWQIAINPSATPRQIEIASQTLASYLNALDLNQTDSPFHFTLSTLESRQK